MSLPILAKYARSLYFEDFYLFLLIPSTPLPPPSKISKNPPHGNSHNFQVCTTLLQNSGKVGHFCAVSPIKFKKKVDRNAIMSLVMRKPALCHIRTTKAQISLHIHAVWSAPLLFAALGSITPILAKSKISRLARFCSCTDWFESYQVQTPEDRFSRDMAQFSIINLNSLSLVDSSLLANNTVRARF